MILKCLINRLKQYLYHFDTKLLEILSIIPILKKQSYQMTKVGCTLVSSSLLTSSNKEYPNCSNSSITRSLP